MVIALSLCCLCCILSCCIIYITLSVIGLGYLNKKLNFGAETFNGGFTEEAKQIYKKKCQTLDNNRDMNRDAAGCVCNFRRR